jgi:hypothetical protein
VPLEVPDTPTVETLDVVVFVFGGYEWCAK